MTQERESAGKKKNKKKVLIVFFLPAVHHNGSGVGRVDSLDLLEEFQHAYGRERHPEVWPAGKMELRDQARGPGSITVLL